MFKTIAQFWKAARQDRGWIVSRSISFFSRVQGKKTRMKAAEFAAKLHARSSPQDSNRVLCSMILFETYINQGADASALMLGWKRDGVIIPFPATPA